MNLENPKPRNRPCRRAEFTAKGETMTEAPLQRARQMFRVQCQGHDERPKPVLGLKQIECPHCVAEAIEKFRRDAIKRTLHGISLAGDKVAATEPLSDSDARASAVAHLMAAASLMRVRLESPGEAGQVDEMARGLAQ